ncbi:hypothetical protein DV736_g2834, partial [Chaetothyriales sp. CBS 134916]
MSNQTITRISKEIAQIQKGSDLSIAVAYQESDMRLVKALVLGPPQTPYEYGFFEFAIRFTNDYPNKPPKVDAKTTNGGRCRFNPNIYAGGKVCLSILGTWHGEKPGEEWSSAQGLESILWSIQSLMSSSPYENEPGYENAKSADDRKNNERYCDKIRHETLRIAVIQKVEEALGIQADGSVEDDKAQLAWDSADEEADEEAKREKDRLDRLAKFDPFKDLCKRRFLWYYDHYLATIEQHAPQHKDGAAFEKMPFESSGNSMDGKFAYTNLHKRLLRIKDVLGHETDKWAAEGIDLKQRESTKAANLQRQFEQLQQFLKQKSIYNLDLALDNDNPFLWFITYIGAPLTYLDGGMFNIRISISPRFPDEQPRVRVLTALYHHRVSKDGVLCYFPDKTDEMKSHVQAIVAALDEESPPFDPRTIVHPEATKLLWGSDEDKREYNRRLRRTAFGFVSVAREHVWQTSHSGMGMGMVGASMPHGRATPAQAAPLGTVLVIGGCGFVGSNVVDQLLNFPSEKDLPTGAADSAPRATHDVVIHSNHRFPSLRSRYPSYDLSSTTVHAVDLHCVRNRYAGCTYHEADITSEDQLIKVFDQVKPDVVINTASPTFDSPKAVLRKVNIDGTKTLIKVASTRCRVLVHTSSSSVVHDGVSDLLGATEDYPYVCPNPSEYYSETKVYSERTVLEANRPADAFYTCAVRPAGIVGEGDKSGYAYSMTYQAAHAPSWQLKIQLGDNTNLFDTTYVGNVAYGLLCAAQALNAQARRHAEGRAAPLDTERVDGQAFNLTNGEPTTFWDQGRYLWACYGVFVEPAQIWEIPKDWAVAIGALSELFGNITCRKGRLTKQGAKYASMNRWFKSDKLIARTGYRPLVGIEEGLQRTVRSFKQDAENAAANESVEKKAQ